MMIHKGKCQELGLPEPENLAEYKSKKSREEN